MDQDCRDIKQILKRFSREDLTAILRDHIGYENQFGKGASLSLDEVAWMSDDDIRKFLFKRDCPNCRW